MNSRTVSQKPSNDNVPRVPYAQFGWSLFDQSSAAPFDSATRAELQVWLVAQLGQTFSKLTWLGSATGGTVHRHDLFSCDDGAAGAGFKIVLRRSVTPAFPGALNLNLQSEVMHSLAGDGLPLPTPIGQFLPGTVGALALPFVEGVSAGESIVAGGQVNSLARKLGTALRAIHSSQFSAGCLSAPLPTWRDQLDCFRDACPRDHRRADQALRALDAAERQITPLCGRSVVLHGDYRTGNYVLGSEGPQILDFDLVHLGDPRMDCAWFLSPSWRYGADRLIAGGVGTLGAFMAGYGARAQDAYTPPWQRFALARWAVMALIQWDRGRQADNPAWMAEETEAALALERFSLLS